MRVVRPAARERGFTLVEVLVVVGIVALGAGLGVASLAQRPAQARSTAVAFAGLVAQARALAAVTGDATVAGASGATIEVVAAGETSIATLYAGRPIAGEPRAPVAANAVPLRATTQFALVAGSKRIAPPFAIFFSPSGHASALGPYTVGVDPPPSAEPACALETGIVIAFIDGVHDQAHAISCEMARLDLDTPSPLGGG